MKKSATEAIGYYLCGTHYFRLQAEELRDAAEFEALCAKKMVKMRSVCSLDQSFKVWSKIWCNNERLSEEEALLAYVRFAVEEEMDG